MKFTKIIACLDMAGCPNRCKHCWLGSTPNGNMPLSELAFVAEQFRPFTEYLEVFDWYREPDYKDDYQERWKLCEKLSDGKMAPTHFELISVWRMVRDKEYVNWLSSLGLKTAQLTIFGGEETTDFYTGRKGAYREILQAIEILIRNRISPRIQTFVNKNNMEELPQIEKLIQDLDLENRCKSFDSTFSFFLHAGACDGENEKFYDVRVTPEDLQKIPCLLKKYTLKHFGKDRIEEVFGKTEKSLYEERIKDSSVASYANDSPVFYIDQNFDVYPNITTPAYFWRLGNLKTDGAQTVLKNYFENRSIAQHIRMTVPICDIVKSQGDSTSERLFGKDDYVTFLLNKYCRNQRLSL